MKDTRTTCLAAIGVLALVVSGCSVYAEPERRPEGAGQEKVTLCHKGKKTLQVAGPAARAHYDHGDRPGPCR